MLEDVEADMVFLMNVQSTERSKHLFACKRGSVESVQRQSKGIHQTGSRDGGEELGRLNGGRVEPDSIRTQNNAPRSVVARRKRVVHVFSVRL